MPLTNIKARHVPNVVTGRAEEWSCLPKGIPDRFTQASLAASALAVETVSQDQPYFACLEAFTYEELAEATGEPQREVYFKLPPGSANKEQVANHKRQTAKASNAISEH